MSEANSQAPSVNRWSVISLGAAILSIGSFCGGIAPIPLTGFVCFPSAFALGLVALASGLWALHRIRLTADRGRGLAITGAGVGGLVLAALTCLLGVGIWLSPTIIELARRLRL